MFKKVKTLFAAIALAAVGLTACAPTTSEPSEPIVPEVTLVSIEATPVTVEFTVGDEFVFDGTVLATYSDETTVDVTEEATFTGYDMVTPGTQEVTVTYEEMTDTYNITVVEPAPLYTPEQVLVDIMVALTGATPIKGTHYGEQAGLFYTTITFGAYGEEYLPVAITTVVNNLPEYVTEEVYGPEEDTWDDGSKGVFAGYATSDYSVAVELGSMIREGTLACQIMTYAIEA